MRLKLNSTIFLALLLGCALSALTPQAARADTVDQRTIVCSNNCYDYASGGPISGIAGIGAWCVDSNGNQTIQVITTGAFNGYNLGFYIGEVNADWSSVGVTTSADIYDYYASTGADVIAFANCDGTTSGYMYQNAGTCDAAANSN
jgi:hypothetical protein